MGEEYPTDTTDMTYVVSLSGGESLAVAAERALLRYGTRVYLTLTRFCGTPKPSG